MINNKNDKSERRFQKFLREGRGSGKGHEYILWIKVGDFGSQGRSHRVHGHKSRRTHHLFSDLELAVFGCLEWNQDTVDIREQFPLRREDTLTLAKSAGVSHPSIAGSVQYMSSDFLVNTKKQDLPKFALQAKYSSDLSKPRTIEKLELERRYWAFKQVPWFLITELDIPLAVFNNIEWLYPSQSDEISANDLSKRIEFYTHYLNLEPESKIIDIAKSLDVAYKLPKGESLFELRQLLAKRFFIFDISRPYLKLKAHELELIDCDSMQEAINV